METNKLVENGITVQFMTVTPAMAREWLLHHNPNNRKVNKRHVKALALNMINGTWVFNGDSLRFDCAGNMLDGQHRMLALIEANKTYNFLVCSGFKHEVMQTIDQEAKKRTLQDLLSMSNVPSYTIVTTTLNRYLAMVEGFTANSARDTSSGGGTSQELKTRYTINDRFDLYFNNRDFFDKCASYAAHVTRRDNAPIRILGAGDVGAYYSFLIRVRKHNEEKVKGFFDRLCLNTAVDIPVINFLRKALMANAISDKKISPATREGLINKAWNFYITGKECKKLIYNYEREGRIKLI